MLTILATLYLLTIQQLKWSFQNTHLAIAASVQTSSLKSDCLQGFAWTTAFNPPLSSLLSPTTTPSSGVYLPIVLLSASSVPRLSINCFLCHMKMQSCFSFSSSKHLLIFQAQTLLNPGHKDTKAHLSLLSLTMGLSRTCFTSWDKQTLGGKWLIKQ